MHKSTLRCLVGIKGAESLFHGLTREDWETEKMGGLVEDDDEDGTMKLESWIWMKEETFSKDWTIACNGFGFFSDILVN